MDGPRPLDASLRNPGQSRNSEQELKDAMEDTAAGAVPDSTEELAGPYIWPEPNFF